MPMKSVGWREKDIVDSMYLGFLPQVVCYTYSENKTLDHCNGPDLSQDDFTATFPFGVSCKRNRGILASA
jgi:hypothetical protein